MPRPLELSFEKIEEYDRRIDNDPYMDQSLAQNPIIREICRAGQYMCDKLVELNCPDIMIARMLYTGGQLSFGRSDPWAIHQDLLDQYINGTLEFAVDPNDLN